MGKFKVIDVSYWNGNLSVSTYKKLKKKGIQAVIARCGYDIDNTDIYYNVKKGGPSTSSVAFKCMVFGY
jgi:GH25 family lysozyme M1 (1,4-beta-N-acetylmuramidase)